MEKSVKYSLLLLVVVVLGILITPEPASKKVLLYLVLGGVVYLGLLEYKIKPQFNN